MTNTLALWAAATDRPTTTDCTRRPDGTLRELTRGEWLTGRWVDVTTHNDPPFVTVYLRLGDLPADPPEEREFKGDDERRPDERLPE